MDGENHNGEEVMTRTITVNLNLEEALVVAEELFQTQIIKQNYGSYFDDIIRHWKMMMHDHGILINWYHNIPLDELEANLHYDDEKEPRHSEVLTKLSTQSIYSIAGFIVGYTYKALDNKKAK